jgi:hypothetical protein
MDFSSLSGTGPLDQALPRQEECTADQERKQLRKHRRIAAMLEPVCKTAQRDYQADHLKHSTEDVHDSELLGAFF